MLPVDPFVGELSYRDLTQVLLENQRRLTLPEQTFIEQLIEYVAFKTTQLQERNGKGH